MPNAATVDAHKEVVALVVIHDMLTNFMARTILPRFRLERINNYKKIMNQFSKMERMNSKNITMMWQSIMHFHKEKGATIDAEMITRVKSVQPDELLDKLE